MLIQRISDVREINSSDASSHKNSISSMMLYAELRQSHLLLGKKRHVQLYEVDFKKATKEDRQISNLCDVCEFDQDIIEFKGYGDDLLVVLDNLHIFNIQISDKKLRKMYAGMIKPLTDSPVVRIKFTSIAISANKDFALLSVFSNSLVVMHLTNSNEEEKIEESKSLNLSIQSTYKYYEHQVNSSLLILQEKKSQRIWHLDEEQNLITSEIVKKHGIVSIISNDESIHRDRTIIDVNYFNNEHIVLLMQNGLQFFNVKEQSLTMKINTPGVTLILVAPLFKGSFEENIQLVGVSSHGE